MADHGPHDDARLTPDRAPNAGAAQSLAACLSMLSKLDLPDAARPLIQRAERLMRELFPPDNGLVDQTTFVGLLELAGPDIAPEMLAQLTEDLRMQENGLPDAIAARDWAAVRSRTHVLLALAGSVGANALYRRLRMLNHAAHAADAGKAELLNDAVMRDLVLLRDFIAEARLQLATKRQT